MSSIFIDEISMIEADMYNGDLADEDYDKMEFARLYFELYCESFADEGVLIGDADFVAAKYNIFEAVKDELIRLARNELIVKHKIKFVDEDTDYSLDFDNFIEIATSNEMSQVDMKDAMNRCSAMRRDYSCFEFLNDPDFKKGNKAIMFALAGETVFKAFDAKLYDVHDVDKYNELSEKLRNPSVL